MVVVEDCVRSPRLPPGSFKVYPGVVYDAIIVCIYRYRRKRCCNITHLIKAQIINTILIYLQSGFLFSKKTFVNNLLRAWIHTRLTKLLERCKVNPNILTGGGVVSELTQTKTSYSYLQTCSSRRVVLRALCTTYAYYIPPISRTNNVGKCCSSVFFKGLKFEFY